MLEVNISAVDLNLLVALDALLREKNVSRAALVRAGHGMVPTPRAVGLGEPLATALQAIRRTLEPDAPFDPATAQRAFRVGATDTTLAVVLPALLARLGSEAPGIVLGTAPLRSSTDCFERLVSAEWDLAIGRFHAAPDSVLRSPLFSDEIVCLARADHPRIRERLTLEAYLAEAHLSVESGAPGDQPFTIEAVLGGRGLARRVVSRLENLAMAPLVVARTDLLCTAPRRTIEPFAEGLGLRMLPPPFQTPAFEIELAWHASADLAFPGRCPEHPPSRSRSAIPISTTTRFGVGATSRISRSRSGCRSRPSPSRSRSSDGSRVRRSPRIPASSGPAPWTRRRRCSCIIPC